MGVRVTRSSTGFLMLIALRSEGGRQQCIGTGRLRSRAISPTNCDGCRVWVTWRCFGFELRDADLARPRKLVGFGISPAEVMAAIREQNAADSRRRPRPATGGAGYRDHRADRHARAFQQRRAIPPDHRARDPGRRLHRAPGRCRPGRTLGNDNYAFNLTLNGQESAGLAVSLTTGANALATATAVRERMQALQETFPPDVRWSTPFDTTPFITESVNGVVRTMIESIILVSIVVLLFLQSWRALFLPTLVVPISLIGTCLQACSPLACRSICCRCSRWWWRSASSMTMRIVIVESVERIMREDKLPPREATAKAMGQLSGAIIATTLVLLAVFIPMGFFPGSAGGIYRQFAVTLSVSLVVSTILSLTLAPAICGALLRPARVPAEGEQPGRGARFFGAINRGLERVSDGYGGAVGRMLGRPWLWLGVFLPSRGRNRAAVRAPARRLPAGRGPGLSVRRLQRCAGLDRGAHPAGGAAGRGDPQAPAGGAQRRHGHRLQFLWPGPERGHVVRRPPALGRTQRARRRLAGAGPAHERGDARHPASAGIRAQPTRDPVAGQCLGLHHESRRPRRRRQPGPAGRGDGIGATRRRQRAADRRAAGGHADGAASCSSISTAPRRVRSACSWRR